MGSLAPLLLLLLVCVGTTRANIIWFYSHSNTKVDPITNLNRALEGYDVVAADSLARVDPGRRKRIFDPLYQDNGRYFLQSFIEEINTDNQNCDTEFKVTPVRSLGEFLSEKRKGYSFFLDVLTDERVSKTSDSPKSVDMKRQPFNGEIIFGKATCVTTVVKIAPFEKPVYTEMFKNALRAFHHASKKPLSLRSKKTAFAFFLTYGTHFMKTVEMGAQVQYWKSSDNTNDDKVKQIENCVSEVFHKSLSNSNGSVVRLTEMFDKNTLKCDSADGKTTGSLLEGSNIAAKDLTVRGALPTTSLNTWASEAQAYPVPIHFELMKISYLFRDDWLDFIDTKGKSDLAQDAEAMFKFFETSLVEYCHKILRSDCAEEVHLEGEVIGNTVQQSTNPKKEDHLVETRTSRAVKATSYGEVYVSAGFANMLRSLKSVEEIGTQTTSADLPDLPEEMGGHSLTAVGSLLYNCGGSTPFRATHSLHRCYSLDLARPNLTWSHVVDLPTDMKNFHTALHVDSQLWFFDRGSFTVYILNQSSTSFHQYRLPFFITNWMCLTEFNATVVAIDTNSGVLFILEHPSDPETWVKIEQNFDTRFSPTCLTINGDVYITGDDRSNFSQNIEVYHSESNEVSRIPAFTLPRVGHSMFVVRGAPAVAGGMERDGKTVYSSTEVFNVTSNSWHVDALLELRSPRVWFALAQVVSEDQ